MINVAVVGLGKMGLSHLAMLNAHPDVNVAAVCDSSSYMLSVLAKYTGFSIQNDYETMLRDVPLDAVLIATPSRTHATMVRSALCHDLHVFCEKPFTLAVADAEELTALSYQRGIVTQVGYHNRFVGAFREAKALLDAGAIGTVTHALGEAYGPVVLKPKGGTWRSRRDEGGGCLHDYAAHPIDLLTWYLGEPIGVGGTALTSVFSRETEDEVSSTVFFPEGRTAHVSANWSDASHRKMTTRVTIWGSAGRIYVDRQECQAFLRDADVLPAGYSEGWNVRYTTDLTDAVSFYLRGEEYSAQLDHFVDRVQNHRVEGSNRFDSAMATDKVIAMMIADARKGPTTVPDMAASTAPAVGPRRTFRLRRRAPALADVPPAAQVPSANVQSTS